MGCWPWLHMTQLGGSLHDIVLWRPELPATPGNFTSCCFLRATGNRFYSPGARRLIVIVERRNKFKYLYVFKDDGFTQPAPSTWEIHSSFVPAIILWFLFLCFLCVWFLYLWLLICCQSQSSHISVITSYLAWGEKV